MKKIVLIFGFLVLAVLQAQPQARKVMVKAISPDSMINTNRLPMSLPSMFQSHC